MLRQYLSGPFEFDDPYMELRYRKDWMSTCLSRNKPLICNFYLPAIALMRFSWLAYWMFYPYELTTIEIVVTLIRVAVVLFVATIFLKSWDQSSMIKFGYSLIWISRILLLLLCLQQVAAEPNDSQTMIAMTTILCCGGLVIPSFSEFLCFALTLPFLRPLKIYMAAPEGFDGDHMQQVLFQQTLLLSLAISVTWTIHSDSRHRWLCSPAISLDKECPRTESCSAGPGHGAGHAAPPPNGCSSLEWDLLADGYFSDAERAEMTPQALQVRGLSPTAP